MIANINWLDVIKTLAPVATTFIAFLALRNWKRQDRAKREVEFLDELIETTHSYVVEIGKPVQLLRFAKIGMASHVNSWEDGEETDKATRGAIAYIEKRGEEDGKRLSAVLGEVRPTVIKLRSLGAKGQVFKFEGYAKCQQAIALLTWHFDRIEAFMFVVASPTWNWQNPEVHKNLPVYPLDACVK